MSLVTTALIVVAALAALAAFRDLRTGWRFTRAVDITGKVEADDGALTSPLSRQTCVLFSLVLSRRQIEDRFGASVQFLEQRPFSVRTADKAWRVDKKDGGVAFVGLDVHRRALPFLPQAVLGLLVSRFGHLGHLWAEDFVVSAAETVVADGATVHLFVDGGRVRTVSMKPLAILGRAALQRGTRAAVVSVVAFVIWSLLR